MGINWSISEASWAIWRCISGSRTEPRASSSSRRASGDMLSIMDCIWAICWSMCCIKLFQALGRVRPEHRAVLLHEPVEIGLLSVCLVLEHLVQLA